MWDRTLQTQLIIQSFAQGGYGSCLTNMPELAGIQQFMGLLSLQREQFRQLGTAVDRPGTLFTELYGISAELKAAANALPTVPVTPEAAGCSMGWGDFPKAEEALQNLAWQNARPKMPSP